MTLSLVRRTPRVARPAALALVALAACGGAGGDGPTGTTAAGTGALHVQLTDAPFPYDSVKSVDVFIVRADAKREDTDSTESSQRVGDDDKNSGGWVTIAEPKAKIEISSLRDGVTKALGTATLPAGTYKGFRLVIDAKQSSVTLKDGTVLTSTSSPGIRFPSAERSGIKIKLDKPVTVADGAAAPTLLIDFDLNESFQVQGGSLSSKNGGLKFQPGIKATIK